MPSTHISHHILGVHAHSGAVRSHAPDAGVLTRLSLDILGVAQQSSRNGQETVAPEFDPGKLRQAGWSILYAPGVTQQMKDALTPLANRRRYEAGDDLFKIFEGPEGYQPGDSAYGWLKRRGAPDGRVDPRSGVPYYILIVGSPEEIPFEFQYHLDIHYGVGRLWFDGDRAAESFYQYAESVIRYETGPVIPTTRKLSVFAPQIHNDDATGKVVSTIARPMISGAGGKPPFGQQQNFKVEPYLGDRATKAAMYEILSSPDPAALMFASSHGMAFLESDHERQNAAQGAIICQDWSGVGPPPSRQYFCADDLESGLKHDGKVHGTVHFLLACFSGGWPEFDTYRELNSKQVRIAKAPGMARLPQKLLSHRNGAALGVFAHIDEANVFSSPEDGDMQLEGYRSIMDRIMSGDTLGNSTGAFNQRWSGLSAEVASLLDTKPVDFKELRKKLVRRDDARNYVLFGDPAVSLRTDEMPVITG